MKKLFALILTLVMVLSLAAWAGRPSAFAAAEIPAAPALPEAALTPPAELPGETPAAPAAGPPR